MKVHAWILLLSLASFSCQAASGPVFVPEMARSAFSGSWSSEETDAPGTASDVTADTIGLDFAGGAFVSNTIEAGVKGGYTDLDAGKTQITTWDAALYGRYYLQDRGQLRPWGELQIGYGKGGNGRANDRNIFWGVGVGLSQFLTESTAIELGLVYERRSFDFGRGSTDISLTALTLAYAIFFG